jgi:BASS family bile acid:Na+ symporter
MARRGLARMTEFLLPLAVAAAALALVVPSTGLSERADLLLAALVLFTALGIDPAKLADLRRHAGAVVALVVVPFALLALLGWLVSLAFSGAISDGVLALGVSSTEVAAVGLVAIAGGSAVLALGALTGSLVLAAVAGPLLLGALAGTDADVAVGELVGRFSLVVLVPLAVGLLVRAVSAVLDRAEPEFAGLAALAVVALVYAAMSGTDAGGELAEATAAAVLFLLATGVVVAGWLALAPAGLRATGAFVIELRDFAVAAALASQAFGPSAATVSGVYGVLMLLLGAAAAHWLPRRLVGDRDAISSRRSARARAGETGRACPRSPRR